MSYNRLLKLLYIADRESLKRHGKPIIGGRLIATERGPSHSAVLELVHGSGADIATWSRFFTVQGFDLKMLDDPGNGELSEREIHMLNSMREEHKLNDDWAVGQFTTEYEEVQKNKPDKGSSTTISFDDILTAIGRSEDLILIGREAKDKALFDQVFGA